MEYVSLKICREFKSSKSVLETKYAFLNPKHWKVGWDNYLHVNLPIINIYRLIPLALILFNRKWYNCTKGPSFLYWIYLIFFLTSFKKNLENIFLKKLFSSKCRQLGHSYIPIVSFYWLFSFQSHQLHPCVFCFFCLIVLLTNPLNSYKQLNLQ